MSDTTDTRPAEFNGWAAGWAGFAGLMLILMGLVNIIQGVVALVDDEFYRVGDSWVFDFEPTTWGWIHLAVGFGLAASGVGIFFGNLLARTVGVIVALLGVLTNFAFLPYYPVWSIILIAIGIAVIWALTVHGRDVVYL